MVDGYNGVLQKVEEFEDVGTQGGKVQTPAQEPWTHQSGPETSVGG